MVVTFNNAEIVGPTLAALQATRWRHDLEIVVVDNASSDGTADLVAAEFPSLRLVRSDTNRGFGGGANLGMGDLADVDAVALVNSDALVEPGWLEPLAAVLESHPDVGAACPKILLAPRFSEVRIAAPVRRPPNGDPRLLGVRVIGADPRALYPVGFSRPEPGWRWTTAEHARLWLPSDAATSLTLAADQPGTAFVQGRPVAVGPTPVEHDLAASETFNVINDVGVELDRRWYGRDRGWLEPDRGQYDRAEDVWAWCGGAVLLDARYLADVGRFDERLFLYYEDLDLAWRGRQSGWRYRFEPASVVRHAHSASSGGEASPFVDHLNQRNRLVVLARHAPAGANALVWARFAAEVARSAWGEIARPIAHARRPHPTITTRRLRSAAAALRLARRPGVALGA